MTPTDRAKHSERRTNESGQARSESRTDPDHPIDGDSPEVIRSQVRGIVPAGHSMVTGGHPLADGSHDFAVISPSWLETANGSELIDIQVELLNLDAAGLKEAGLDSLVTADRKSEQNAEVWTPEELARTMKEVDVATRQAKPRVIVSPGSPARITVGTEGGLKFELELSATAAANGGFELSTDLKRIE